MTEKWATPEGTEKFFQWTPIDPTKRRSFCGLTLSALGAGTHMGPADEATDRLYEQTLVQAAQCGINCFDTSISDRKQRSEKLLKKVFIELANRGIFRNQLFLSTKGGYVPSHRTQFFEMGILELADIVADSHCMKPSFLDFQIATSLKNLGLDSIDLYYIENPELQLATVGEEEFYRRLEESFRFLEEKVREQKIRSYGLATWNGFRQKKQTAGLLQIKKVVECAIQAGGKDHHLKAIQLPFNLVMLEAYKIKNQGSQSIFQAAQDQDIAIFTSSCLMQSQVMHLPASFYEKLPVAPTPAIQAIEFVLSTPGVLAAYVGMKKLEHVVQNGRTLLEPTWSKESWDSVRSVLSL